MNLHAENNPKPHSKTGIASFVIEVLNLLGFILFMVYQMYSLNNSFDPDTIIAVAFGSIAAGVVFIIVLCIGFLLGIISLFQRDTKKLYGVLGLFAAVINILVLVLVVALYSVTGATF